MKISSNHSKKQEYLLKFLFLLMIFQTIAKKIGLTDTFPILGYIDEVVSGFCMLYITVNCIRLINMSKFRNVLKFLFAFIVIGLFSTFNSGIISLENSLLQVFLDFKFLSISIVVALLSLKINPDLLKKWILVFLKSILILNIPLIIMQYVSPDLLDSIFNMSGAAGQISIKGLKISRATGIFWHPSELASFCAFSIFIFAFLVKDSKYLILSIIQLLLTLQRFEIASICTLLFLVYVIIERRRGMNKYTLIKVAPVLIGIVVFFFVFLDVFADTFQIYAENTLTGTEDPRIVFFLKGFEISNDYFPLGSGFGSYAGYVAKIADSDLYRSYHFDIFRFYREDIYMTDTYLPHIFTEVGYIGFIFYVFLYINLFKFLVSLYPNNFIVYLSYIFTFGYIFLGVVTSPVINDPTVILWGSFIPVCFANKSLRIKGFN